VQRAPAIGTPFQPRVWTRKVSAQPMATRGALRIDALHGPAGQILHSVSLSGRASLSQGTLGGRASRMAGILPLEACGVKRKDHHK
jgi:hypothetical protein